MTKYKNKATAKKKPNPTYMAVPVYDDNFDEIITDANVLEKDAIYVFKIIKKRENGVDSLRANLLGHFQAAGLCALVSGDENEEQYTTFDGTQVPVYSEAYFKDVYNVETVKLVAIPDSPFTCEKLGVRLQVHSGGEFDNIDSNSDAVERADWETYKSARLTDSISLTTKLVPFINDVNFKVQYQPINEDLAHEYLVTSISHDFYGGTTSWTLVRFYAYYIPEDAGKGSWDDDSVTPDEGTEEISPEGIGTIYQTWDSANEHVWNYFSDFQWRDLYYKEYTQYVVPDSTTPEEESESSDIINYDSSSFTYTWDDLKDMTWRMAKQTLRW